MIKQGQLPKGSYSKILHDYNEHFSESPALKTTYTVASKKFLPITRIFTNKWNPQESKIDFMSTFSVQEWIKLDSSAKATHTLRACSACTTIHESASQSFPNGSKSHKKTKTPSVISISFSPNELSTPERFGSTLLAKGNSVCQAKYHKSVQTVLAETPRSRLVSKQNHRTRLFQKRKVLREIKNTVEKDMNTDSDMLVLQNRISWEKFDNVRKTQGLVNTENRKVDENAEETPSRKRKHGCKSVNLGINRDQLLQEAQSWQPNQ